MASECDILTMTLLIPGRNGRVTSVVVFRRGPTKP